MTQFYRYRNAIGASSSWAVDLGNDAVRLGELEGLTEIAEHCQAGTSTVTIDDPDADVGHSSDAILGHQRFELDETAMASGNRRVFTSLIGERRYRRRASSETDSLRLGASREIVMQVHDLNAYLSMVRITGTDGKRPSETVGTRLEWILGSDYLDSLVDDAGLVIYPSSKTADKTDYRGQTAANVIGDCELVMGYNAFVYWDDTTQRPALFFDDPNTSTAYSSTLRISNVLSDVDTTTAASFLTGTTFAPSLDAELTRDPVNVASGVYLPYARGAVYETRDATVDTYGLKDGVAPNANVRTSAKASEIAERFLWDSHTEEDRITCEVQLPTNKVNLIRAGHRLEVKFSHLPGYESFTWTRVLRRTVMQKEATDDRYTVGLELSPQEAAAPTAAIVQRAFDRSAAGGKTLSFPNPVTVGSLLVVASADRSVSNPASPNTGPDLPRFGAGAWTKVPNVEITTIDTTAGCAIWVKEADSTERECWIPQSNANIGIWEISVPDAAATIAGITAVSKTEQTESLTMAIGSLGTAPVGSIGILVLNWADHTSVIEGPGMPAVAASGWTIRLYDSAYEGAWYLENTPYTVIADALGTGAALAATVTKSALSLDDGEWCGAAILIEPQ